MLNNNILNLLLVGAGVYLFARYQKTTDQQNFNRNLDQIKNKPLPRPVVPTILPAEAKAIAERQFIAMNRPGTDENELFRALNGLNGADLRLVYEQFGVRNYFTLRRPLDLFGWYVEELDRAELDRMRVYWYKSGLKF